MPRTNQQGRPGTASRVLLPKADPGRIELRRARQGIVSHSGSLRAIESLFGGIYAPNTGLDGSQEPY